MLKKKILIIEDEPSLILFLSDRLKDEGYQVVSKSEGMEGFSLAMEETFDLIILDIMLHGKNGYDICRDLRTKNFDTPILMLSAKHQVVDKVVGLKMGADDYLSKPFEVVELLARIEALLRRSPLADGASPNSFSFGSINIDLNKAEITNDGEPIELSAKEFKLLCHLFQSRNRVFSRDELLDSVWGYNSMPNSRTVDVHIASLRNKIESNPKHPKYIITVHGFGYKFVG